MSDIPEGEALPPLPDFPMPDGWITVDAWSPTRQGWNADSMEEYAREYGAACARAVLAAPPSDFVMVPRVPTPEMVKAGSELIAVIYIGGNDGVSIGEEVTQSYRAMLAAAPLGVPQNRDVHVAQAQEHAPASSTAAPVDALAERITSYLITGGLFNPELADHIAVRDLLIECRDAFRAARATGDTSSAPRIDALAALQAQIINANSVQDWIEVHAAIDRIRGDVAQAPSHAAAAPSANTDGVRE